MGLLWESISGVPIIDDIPISLISLIPYSYNFVLYVHAC